MINKLTKTLTRRHFLHTAAGLSSIGMCIPAYGLRRSKQHDQHKAQMAYLENDQIKVGIDLNLGGAITYLASKNDNINMVNTWDWGRQIQMSYYSGPNPYTKNGKQPAKTWAKLGWNPIQVGDHFGTHSKLLDQKISKDEIYVKCRPMLWPMNNVPANCTFEIWITINNNAVRVQCQLNNAREDITQYPGRGQEVPAVYTNAPYYRLLSYTGEKPYTGQPVTAIHDEKAQLFPWKHWYATEQWAALVNEHNQGLGIYQPEAHHYLGGFSGQPGKGGPADGPTGYFSPVRKEIIDHNITHRYRYDLILGSVKEIRDYVYQHATRPKPPRYIFEKDRQGWTYRKAIDKGWPIRNYLEVNLGTGNDANLLSPDDLWYAHDGQTVKIMAALNAKQTDAKLFFSRLNEKGFSAKNIVPFKMKNDGKFHTYTVKLSENANYKGLITHLRFDPIDAKEAGAWIKVKSIVVE